MTAPREKWTEETVMPWGKYGPKGDTAGRKLSEIPPDYFVWLKKQNWIRDWPALYIYIEDNLERFNKELAEESKDDESKDKGYSSYKDFTDDR